MTLEEQMDYDKLKAYNANLIKANELMLKDLQTRTNQLYDCRDDMAALLKDLKAVGNGTKLCFVCLHKDKCSKCDDCNFDWRGRK